MANQYTGDDTGKAGLRMREADGSPDVAGVSDIIVSNATLTDDGNGTVTLTTGGGGGGTVTSVAVSGGTTGLTTSGGPITGAGTITVAGTLVVANGGTGATSLTDNAVLTGTGTSAVTAEGNLSFDGSTLAVTGAVTISTNIEIDGALNHDGSTVGFYGTTPASQGAVSPYPPPAPLPFATDPILAGALDIELAAIAVSIDSIVVVLQTVGLSS